MAVVLEVARIMANVALVLLYIGTAGRTKTTRSVSPQPLGSASKTTTGGFI